MLRTFRIARLPDTYLALITIGVLPDGKICFLVRTILLECQDQICRAFCDCWYFDQGPNWMSSMPDAYGLSDFVTDQLSQMNSMVGALAAGRRD